MDQDHPSLSFMAIVDFSEYARWIYLTASVVDLLGYEPKELVGRSSLELVHPDEAVRTKRLHYDTIRADQAAVVVYLRMKHKVPSKGYVLCSISRTVVHNVLVGSVSFASPSKAMHNASTAQEVTVLTPGALNLRFGRWHDPPPINRSIDQPLPQSTPSPPPHSPPTPGSASSVNNWRSSSQSPVSPAACIPLPRSRSMSTTGSESDGGSPHKLHRGDPGSGFSSQFTFPDTDPGAAAQGAEKPFTFSHLPNQSLRTLFILDRFSRQCPIMYCSNDLLVTTVDVMGRSFFDFVSQKDEPRVRTWLEQVKSWGVNERGEPSDGGFGYGGFELLTKGRDASVDRLPEPTSTSPKTSRNRQSNGYGYGERDASGRRLSHSRKGRGNADKDLYSYTAQGQESIAHGGIQLPPLTGLGMGGSPKIAVDAIFSAHSDGLMVVLRRSVDG